MRRIAEVAGVSTATVSRAKVVSEKFRTRISSVITEFGWGGPRPRHEQDPYHRRSLYGPGDFARALDTLDMRSHTLLLARSRYSTEQEHRQVVKLIDGGVDGLVLVGRTRPNDLSPMQDAAVSAA